MWIKNDVIQGGGAGKLGKNDFTLGQANSTGMPPDHKVNKAEEQTYGFQPGANVLKLFCP